MSDIDHTPEVEEEEGKEGRRKQEEKEIKKKKMKKNMNVLSETNIPTASNINIELWK